jgi:hypothetical protein
MTAQTCARPTLPGPEGPSTIGDASLNFRVRDGNGCDPCSIAHRFGLSLVWLRIWLILRFLRATYKPLYEAKR